MLSFVVSLFVCLVITEWETVLSHSGDDDDVDRFEDEMVGRV